MNLRDYHRNAEIEAEQHEAGEIASWINGYAMRRGDLPLRELLTRLETLARNAYSRGQDDGIKMAASNRHFRREDVDE